MRKAVVLVAISAALVGLFASAASAKNSVHRSRPNLSGSCSGLGGSCFVPDFPAAGSAVQYSGPAAYWVGFADCCAGGDTYKVTAKGPDGSSTLTFTSSSPSTGCLAGGTYNEENYIGLNGGATKVTMKAISLPGGAPAGAYIEMSSTGWTQHKGTDECGF
jgi:hypothetical protein